MLRPKRFALLFLICASISSASVHAADKIRIGYPGPAAQFIPLQLAQKKGFLREEGLEAEVIRISGNAPIAALVNGDIDYYTSIGTGVRAALQSLPLKVAACYVPAPPFMLVARPEFKSVKDLVSTTVGIQSFRGPTDIVARMILKHFGLEPEKDVKFLTTGEGPARLAAMKQGLTAATVISAPGDFQGMNMGFVILAKAHELFSYPDSGVVASMKKIKERRDEVKRVIKAGIKASRYIRENREETIHFLIERQKINKELAAATYDGVSKAFNEDGNVPEDGLRLVIEEAKKLAKIERVVSLTEVADLSILRNAQKELGIRGR
jgi:ABC-type nitrate/sulfonate/bicarbonate transport system substrate-binding protein